MTRTKALLTVAAAAAAFAGIHVASPHEAHADVRVRVGGSAHVHVGGGVRVRGPYVHWRVRRPPPPPPPRIHVEGAIWVGGGVYVGRTFAPPPPPPPPCDCGPANYHPVVPAPTTYAVAPAPARPPLPRWGLGVAAGGVSVEGRDGGDDLALLGRLRLTPRLLVEGEVGKSELADGARVDRRLGASLAYELSPYNRFTPYVVGGLGVTQVEVSRGAYESSQSFGEIGVGLRYALTPSVHLMGDLRAGSRSEIDRRGSLDYATRPIAPEPDTSEEYTRARLAAVLYF